MGCLGCSELLAWARVAPEMTGVPGRGVAVSLVRSEGDAGLEDGPDSVTLNLTFVSCDEDQGRLPPRCRTCLAMQRARRAGARLTKRMCVPSQAGPLSHSLLSIG